MSNSTWNGSSADWSDAADWSGGVPDASTISAIIDGTSAFTLTIAGGDPGYMVGGVTFNDANATFDLAGSLNVSKLFTFTAGTVDLSGTLSGGSISDTGGTFDFSSGALENLTFEGALNLENMILYATNLTLTGAGGGGDGSLNIEGGSTLFANVTQTLNNATVDIGTDGTNGNAIIFDASGGANTLTLGAGLIVIDGTGTLKVLVGGEILNQGSITFGTAALSGRNPLIDGAGTFVNQGSITVTDDDVLSIDTGTFTNTGSITVDSGATLDLGLNFTGGLPAGVTVASGGTLQLDGTVTNGGTITTTAGETLLLRGEIVGGTLNAGTGTFDFSSGALENLTFEGALNLENMILNATNLTLTGAGGSGDGSLNIEGGSTVYANVTQTLNNATIDIGTDGTNGNAIIFDASGGANTLTLGAGLTVIDGTGTLKVLVGGEILNQGSITFGTAAISGRNPLIDGAGTFVNQGSIIVTDDEALDIGNGTFINTGAVDVISGELSLEVSVGGVGSETIGAAGTIQVQGVVAATQTISFASGAGGELQLDDPSGAGFTFAGVVSGFAPGDTIDLPTFAFSGTPGVGWTQNGASGVLTVSDGADVATITLQGHFTAADFTVTSDSQGDTQIGVTTASGASKYIDTSVYAVTGYTLNGQYPSITIGSKGVIGGPGLAAGGPQSYSIVNGGTITGAYNAVFLKSGGTVTNLGAKALIEGVYVGVAMDGYGVVTNTGSIQGTGSFGVGVDLTAGGRVTNSGAASVIAGIYAGVEIGGAAGTVVNSGLIRAPNSNGVAVYLGAGGYVGNRAGALVEGFDGVSIGGGASTVTNSGTIDATGSSGVSVYLSAGGSVTNSGAAALIEGNFGVEVTGDVGAVTNAGTIFGILGDAGNSAVEFLTGGVVTNDSSGLISGYINGVNIEGAGTVTNAGEIQGDLQGVSITGPGATVTNTGEIVTISALGGGVKSTNFGVYLHGGGVVYNTGTNASIAAYYCVVMRGVGTVDNTGTILTQDTKGIAINLSAGGIVTNGAYGLVESYNGFAVEISGAAGTINDTGAILATGTAANAVGVYLHAGGVVTVGAGGLIEGYDGVKATGVAATVINAGSITGYSTDLFGVNLGAGGAVTNNAGGYIGGVVAVVITGGAGNVVNSGSIVSAFDSSDSVGVSLEDGGIVTNSGTSSIVYGRYYGVKIAGGAGMVSNSGTIRMTDDLIGTTNAAGVYLRAGGIVINGGTAGLIGGYFGVKVTGGAGTVVNTARILSSGGANGAGVYLESGGVVTNNAGGLIEGYYAVAIEGVGAVANTGTIKTGASGLAVDLRGGGVVTNNAGGLIEGYYGVRIMGASGSVGNTGTIDATGTMSGSGVNLGAGGEVSNTAGGLIEGFVGVEGGANTIVVTNAGTIESNAGADGTAVLFTMAGDVLIDQAGATFVGKVVGDGGTLELAGAAPGVLSGFATTYTGIAVVDLESGSDWAFSGANTVGAATQFYDYGTLVVSNGVKGKQFTPGVLKLEDTSVIAGVVAGTTLEQIGGTMTLDGGATLTVSAWTLTSTTAIFNSELSYGGAFTESVSTLSLAGHRLSLTGTAGFTGGTVAGGGLLTTHGAVSLDGLTLVSSATWLDDGVVTQTGALTLGNSSGGSGKLLIAAGGVFDITANVGVAVAPGGAGSIGNSGLLEKTVGTGVGAIAVSVNNDGTFAATAGTLKFDDAVTGVGAETIGNAGTLEFNGAVVGTQTVSFAGTTGGDLVLNDPSGAGLSFEGSIAGFSGADKIDLATFAFSGHPTLAWSQTGSIGVLTVTDGSDMAKVTLFGQYIAADFQAATDGHAGSDITYSGPPPIAMLTALPH